MLKRKKKSSPDTSFVLAQLPTAVRFEYGDEEDSKSIISSTASSNQVIPELPTRYYLDDAEFARSLQVEPSSCNENSKRTQKGGASMGNSYVLAQLPMKLNFENEDEKDTQSLGSTASSNAIVPELPTRNYLDDNEFALSLQVEPTAPPSQDNEYLEEVSGPLSRMPHTSHNQRNKSRLEDCYLKKRKQGDAHSKGQRDASNLEEHCKKQDNHSTDQYVNLTFNTGGEEKGEDQHYVSLSESMQRSAGESSLEISMQKDVHTLDGPYMSLSEATMQRSSKKGESKQDGQQNGQSYGDYMELDKSTRERFIKSKAWA